MINESHFYKKELKKISIRMKKRQSQKRWTEYSLFLFEKDVFVGFYFIRKLIEAKTKISTKNSSLAINLKRFVAAGKIPHIMNRYDIDSLYKMDNAINVTKTLSFLCNQAIHSYVCRLYYTDAYEFYDTDNADELGLIFNSFDERKKCLYYITITQLIHIFDKISADYPNGLNMTYNNETGDYDFYVPPEQMFSKETI